MAKHVIRQSTLLYRQVCWVCLRHPLTSNVMSHVSRQRKRHLGRQPTEESIRLAVSDLVGTAGDVDVQRMSYDWRADDVLVQVHLKEPLSGLTLANFRAELASVLHGTVPRGGPLEDWLVVIECKGKEIARVAPYDKMGESREWGSET